MKNKSLKNLFKLGSKVQFYVPATIHADEIDNTAYVEQVAECFSSWFGGATSTQARGYWTSPTEGLIKENTTIVFAYCTEEQLKSNIDNLVELAEATKTSMSQEAIAIEINGELYFV